MKKTISVSVIAALIGLPLLLMAGTTGKIAGVVENKTSGEPIPGATIRVIGTDLVTQTDADGRVFRYQSSRRCL